MRAVCAFLMLGGTLAGCRSEKAAPPPPGAFQVVAPAPGEAWTEGSTHVIRWRNAPWDSVSIGAAMGGKDKGHLVLSYPAEADSLVWTIPPGFVSGFGPTESRDVRLRFEHSSNPGHFFDSEPFTIRAP